MPAAAHDSTAAHCRTIPVSASVSAPSYRPSGPAASPARRRAPRTARPPPTPRHDRNRAPGSSGRPRLPAGHPARPGVVGRLPAHDPPPFDRSDLFKLLIEYYYEPLTFRRDTPGSLESDPREAEWVQLCWREFCPGEKHRVRGNEQQGKLQPFPGPAAGSPGAVRIRHIAAARTKNPIVAGISYQSMIGTVT